jgi:hypothetical protein
MKTQINDQTLVRLNIAIECLKEALLGNNDNAPEIRGALNQLTIIKEDLEPEETWIS